MLAAAQSAFGDEEEDDPDTLSTHVEEELPKHLPSWAVSRDQDPKDELLASLEQVSRDEESEDPATNSIPIDGADDPSARDAIQEDTVLSSPVEDIAQALAQLDATVDDAPTDQSEGSTDGNKERPVVDTSDILPETSGHPEAQMDGSSPGDETGDDTIQDGVPEDDRAVDEVGDGAGDASVVEDISAQDGTTEDAAKEEEGARPDRSPSPFEPTPASSLADLADAAAADDIIDDSTEKRQPIEVAVHTDQDPRERAAENPWNAGDGPIDSIDDGMDVPISTLPVPAVYQELRDLPPEVEERAVDRPSSALADTTDRDVILGDEWEQSAQGWVEAEDGSTAWRPIVTTSDALSGWSIETYLGVVTGDVTLHDADGAGALASARRDATE